jgi:hypothetical protein
MNKNCRKSPARVAAPCVVKLCGGCVTIHRLEKVALSKDAKRGRKGKNVRDVPSGK